MTSESLSSPGAGAPRVRSRLALFLGCALFLVLVEGTCVLVQNGARSLTLPYWTTCAGLTCALSLPFGILPLRPKGQAVALAAWTGTGAGLVAGPLVGVLLGLIAAAGALWQRESSELVRALRHGGGLAAALLLTGRIASLPFLRNLEWGETLAPALVLALFVFVRIPRHTERDRGQALVLVALLALVCVRPALVPKPDVLPFPPPDRSRPALADAKNVFVLVLDTVRADHLSVYGYERDTTPELARLLAETPRAKVYQRAYSNGTWTVPSHVSLFTGQLPSQHGAHFSLDEGPRFGFAVNPELGMLATALQDAGYITCGVFANHWLRVVAGMHAGFDRYTLASGLRALPLVGEALRAELLPGASPEVSKEAARASVIHRRIRHLLNRSPEGHPIYVFANYGDAHGPYAPPTPYRGTYAPHSVLERPGHLSIHQDPERHRLLEARYDEEILYLDAQLGEFFGELKERGLFDDSWIFITSDHGEAFGEHGVTEHGTAVYDEVVRIPLIVIPPRGTELPAAQAPVSLVDVTATVAAVCGVEFDSVGRDLRSDLSGNAARIEFYGDPFKGAIHGPLASLPARSVQQGSFKLIVYAEGRSELYDLEQDPGETRNLAEERPELLEELEALLPEWGTPTDTGPGSGGGAHLEALRKLGYGG